MLVLAAPPNAIGRQYFYDVEVLNKVSMAFVVFSLAPRRCTSSTILRDVADGKHPTKEFPADRRRRGAQWLAYRGGGTGSDIAGRCPGC